MTPDKSESAKAMRPNGAPAISLVAAVGCHVLKRQNDAEGGRHDLPQACPLKAAVDGSRASCNLAKSSVPVEEIASSSPARSAV
jgi:methylthioribose-1-phosphate isomerase